MIKISFRDSFADLPPFLLKKKLEEMAKTKIFNTLEDVFRTLDNYKGWKIFYLHEDSMTRYLNCGELIFVVSNIHYNKNGKSVLDSVTLQCKGNNLEFIEKSLKDHTFTFDEKNKEIKIVTKPAQEIREKKKENIGVGSIVQFTQEYKDELTQMGHSKFIDIKGIVKAFPTDHPDDVIVRWDGDKIDDLIQLKRIEPV